MSTQSSSVTLRIGGMTCASCVRRVERALGKVDGVDIASVNFAAETALVTPGPGSNVPVESLIAAVTKAGYSAEIATEENAHHEGAGRRDLWVLLAGAALAIPVVVLAMGLDIAGLAIAGNRELHGWILLALTAPIQFGLGWKFYRGSFASLRHLNPNMDVLVALGTSVAFGYSAYVVLDGMHHHAFFDVSAAVIVFISMGRYFEDRSKREASAALRALAGLAAKTAIRLEGDAEVEVPVSAVRPGDVVLVRPGERVPVDGILRSGHATVDESMLTGEAIPVERRTGDALLAGTIVQDGVARLEATSTGADSAVHQLSKLVEEAQGSKAPIQRLVDQVAAVFVPVVVVIAAGVLLGWGVIGNDWSAAIRNTVAVLVIACPCALGLATPTAIMVGTGVAASRGILIRNADVLQRARRLNAIVVDKTGTLTTGQPQVTTVRTFGTPEDELLALAATVEAASAHPLSRAVVDAAVERNLALPELEWTNTFVARGVAGGATGKDIAAGNRALMADLSIAVPAEAEAVISEVEARGETPIIVAIDGAVAGVLGLADSLKPAAVRAVATLQRQGLRVIMATGDHERAAAQVAAAAGITEFRAGVRPEDKLELVRELQAKGLSVAMVGDGVNDAPALAQADIGIAMSTGTDVAIETGDITLLHGDITRVAEAVALSRSTMATIRQNLVWAFGYNVVAIPIAAAGLLNPIIAGGAMALSSVSVMANSLRLQSRGRAIAREAGNREDSIILQSSKAFRGPLAAIGAAVVILVVPLMVFVAMDRDWIGGGSDDAGMGGDGAIRVELTNWKIEPSVAAIPAGAVTFHVVHPEEGHSHEEDHSHGGGTHDLVILRELPGGDTEMVARSPILETGESTTMSVNLPPGDYIFLCDVVEEVDGEMVSHTLKGMRLEVTVS